MASFLTMMATTSSPQSSCQPHHHASSWEVWEIGNAWIQAWKHSWAQNPVFFRVKWLPWSPKEGLCFHGFAARSGKWSTTCARFYTKIVKKLSVSERFWKTRPAKGAARARFHMSTTSSASSWSHKIAKNCEDRSTCGRWGRQKVHETVAIA